MKGGSTDQILAGQIILIICCIFYLIWWSMSYRPGTDVNKVGGVRGVLLLATALCGLAGVIISAMWAGSVPAGGSKLTGTTVAAAGVIVYIVLLLITKNLLGRQVTTELFLIVGWVVLEVTVLLALKRSGGIGPGGFAFMIAVVAAAFAVSMILYVMYYRMEAGKAFYAAMVPLITEAVSMAALVITVLAAR
ncbi:MAG: hypothetical protein ACOYJH_01010 [Anaerovoracaceae bacterium]|jgi:hypothetical protein